MYFARPLLNYLEIGAMLGRNAWRPLHRVFVRLLPTMGGSVSTNVSRDIRQMISKICKLVKSQGLKGTVKFLKVVAVVTQQSISGHITKDLTPLGPRISRTKGKLSLPRFFPRRLRRLMKIGNPFSIRLGLTVSSLYRDIRYPGIVNLSTITSPGVDMKRSIEFFGKYSNRFTRLFAKFGKTGDFSATGFKLTQDHLKKVERLPVNSKGLTAFEVLGTKNLLSPVNSSGPTTYPFHKDKEQGGVSSHPLSAFRAGLLLVIPSNRHLLEPLLIISQSSPSIQRMLVRIDRWRHRWARDTDFLSWARPWGYLTVLGKLAIKHEAAGKERVFAMVDPWTQSALRPLHHFLFSILRRNGKVDGTFDQLGPLSRAVKFKSLYSLDLTAATDRLPIDVQVLLLKTLFGSSYSQAWKDLLVARGYRFNRELIYYKVGQPMGALSSWAMLAYTHHFIVQCAAWSSSVTPRRKLFTQYCVLGDDIVIGDTLVARQYLRILKMMGVECSLAKSVISRKGIGLEFAKKTFLRGENVSPSPIKELVASISTLGGFVEYSKKYSLTLPQAVKVLGFGYKVLGGLDRSFHKQSSRIRALIIMLSSPTTVEGIAKFLALGHKKPLLWKKYVIPLTRFINSELISLRVLIEKQKKNLPASWQKGEDKIDRVSFKPAQEILEDLRVAFYFESYSRTVHQLNEATRGLSRLLDTASYVGVIPAMNQYFSISKIANSVFPRLYSLDLSPRETTLVTPAQIKMWRRWNRIFTGRGIWEGPLQERAFPLTYIVSFLWKIARLPVKSLFFSRPRWAVLLGIPVWIFVIRRVWFLITGLGLMIILSLILAGLQDWVWGLVSFFPYTWIPPVIDGLVHNSAFWGYLYALWITLSVYMTGIFLLSWPIWVESVRAFYELLSDLPLSRWEIFLHWVAFFWVNSIEFLSLCGSHLIDDVSRVGILVEGGFDALTSPIGLRVFLLSLTFGLAMWAGLDLWDVLHQPPDIPIILIDNRIVV